MDSPANPDVTWITPFRAVEEFERPLSLDDKITIFQERTLGWQIDVADHCINGRKDAAGNVIAEPVPHAVYGVLHILFSYFEMIAKYKALPTQKQKSEEFFAAGLHDVFPVLNQYPQHIQDIMSKRLYGDVRCGLYHGGTPKGCVTLMEDRTAPILLDLPHPAYPHIYINPWMLPSFIREHFERYVAELRDETNIQLREGFERRFDVAM